MLSNGWQSNFPGFSLSKMKAYTWSSRLVFHFFSLNTFLKVHWLTLCSCLQQIEAEYACVTSLNLKGSLHAGLHQYLQVSGNVQSKEWDCCSAEAHKSSCWWCKCHSFFFSSMSHTFVVTVFLVNNVYLYGSHNHQSEHQILSGGSPVFFLSLFSIYLSHQLSVSGIPVCGTYNVLLYLVLKYSQTNCYCNNWENNFQLAMKLWFHIPFSCSLFQSQQNQWYSDRQQLGPSNSTQRYVTSWHGFLEDLIRHDQIPIWIAWLNWTKPNQFYSCSCHGIQTQTDIFLTFFFSF